MSPFDAAAVAGSGGELLLGPRSKVEFRKRRFLAEGRIAGKLTFEYVDFLADFHGEFTIWTRQRLKSVGSLSQFHSVMVPHKHSRPSFFTKAHLGSSIEPFGGLKGRALRVFGQALVVHPRRDLDYRMTLEAGTNTCHVEPIQKQP